MKTTKRIVALFISLIFMAIAFAGCNGNPKKSEKPPHEHVNADGKYNDLGSMYHSYECDECGAKVKERHKHRYVGNVNGHENKCACGSVRGSFKDHEMRDGECRRCGWRTDAEHKHELYFDSYFDDYHYFLCRWCEKRERAAHDLSYGFDDEGHYLKCVCGYRESTKSHRPDENGECTVCGYKGNA